MVGGYITKFYYYYFAPKKEDLFSMSKKKKTQSLSDKTKSSAVGFMQVV